MDIRIKKAGVFEARLLAQLGVQTFYDAFASFNKEEDMDAYMNVHYTEQRLAQELNAEGAEFYIAYQNGKAIGFAKTGQQGTPGELVNNSCRELERIYVLKQFQSLKVGEELLLHCIARAREDDIEILWLGVWEHNERAIAFYKRHGFERFSEHIFQLGSDAQTDFLFKLNLK